MSLHSTSRYPLFSDILLDHRCSKLLPSRFSVKEPICKVPEVVQGFYGVHSYLTKPFHHRFCLRQACVFVVLCKDKETPKPEAAGEELTCTCANCSTSSTMFVCPQASPSASPSPAPKREIKRPAMRKPPEPKITKDRNRMELSDDGWQTVEKRCCIYIYIYERVDWTANCILRLSGLFYLN